MFLEADGVEVQGHKESQNLFDCLVSYQQERGKYLVLYVASKRNDSE